MTRRHAFGGLFILAALPLPEGGAWTGLLIAAMLHMRLRRAFPPVVLGVIAAGIIVALVTADASAMLFANGGTLS